MIAALLLFLLQGGASPESVGVGVGAGGAGLAGVIFYFYRQERSTNGELTRQAFDALRANTQAITELRDALKSRSLAECPLIGQNYAGKR